MMISGDKMVITHLILILLCLSSMVELHSSFFLTTPPPLPACPADLTLNLCANGADGSPCSTGRRFIDRIITKLFPLDLCQEGFECCKSDKGLGLCNNIDDCTADSCINGDCLDGINNFSCECDVGFTGDICENDIDDCADNPCGINGNCTDAINNFSCACDEGFTGDICETDIDDCSDNPCGINGNCTDGVNSFSCVCDEGFTGDTCETASCFFDASEFQQVPGTDCNGYLESRAGLDPVRFNCPPGTRFDLELCVCEILEIVVCNI